MTETPARVREARAGSPHAPAHDAEASQFEIAAVTKPDRRASPATEWAERGHHRRRRRDETATSDVGVPTDRAADQRGLLHPHVMANSSIAGQCLGSTVRPRGVATLCRCDLAHQSARIMRRSTAPNDSNAGPMHATTARVCASQRGDERRGPLGDALP
jgi:hypothetical protein